MKISTTSSSQPSILAKLTAEGQKELKYLTTSDLSKLKSWDLIQWTETSDYLTEDAKDILKQRIGNVSQVPETSLKQEWAKEKYPQWFKVMIVEELKRRNAFQSRVATKQQKRAEYVRNKPKQRTSAYFKLLEPHVEHSIFKVKWQFKEPNQHGLYWKTKKLSYDYADERQYFQSTPGQYLRNMVKQKGDYGYELFDKNGLRDKGFNGFMYSMKTFNSLRMDDKIGFFAVYLNNIMDPHINGELYSMEIWRWGELRS